MIGSGTVNACKDCTSVMSVGMMTLSGKFPEDCFYCDKNDRMGYRVSTSTQEMTPVSQLGNWMLGPGANPTTVPETAPVNGLGKERRKRRRNSSSGDNYRLSTSTCRDHWHTAVHLYHGAAGDSIPCQRGQQYITVTRNLITRCSRSENHLILRLMWRNFFVSLLQGTQYPTGGWC